MAEQTTTPAPAGTYTLTVPLTGGGTASYVIKDMNEEVWAGAQALIDKKRDNEAVRMIVKALKVSGDDVDQLKNDFRAQQSLNGLILEWMKPVPGEIKKN